MNPKMEGLPIEFATNSKLDAENYVDSGTEGKTRKYYQSS